MFEEEEEEALRRTPRPKTARVDPKRLSTPGCQEGGINRTAAYSRRLSRDGRCRPRHAQRRKRPGVVPIGRQGKKIKTPYGLEMKDETWKKCSVASCIRREEELSTKSDVGYVKGNIQ